MPHYSKIIPKRLWLSFLEMVKSIAASSTITSQERSHQIVLSLTPKISMNTQLIWNNFKMGFASSRLTSISTSKKWVSKSSIKTGLWLHPCISICNFKITKKLMWEVRNRLPKNAVYQNQIKDLIKLTISQNPLPRKRKAKRKKQLLFWIVSQKEACYLQLTMWSRFFSRIPMILKKYGK